MQKSTRAKCNHLQKIMFRLLDRENFLKPGIERLWVIALNHNKKIQNIELVSCSKNCRQTATPTDIFRIPVTLKGEEVILVYSPADGDITLSDDDYRLINRIIGSGLLLGVGIADYMTINSDHCISLEENGVMKELTAALHRSLKPLLQ